MKEILDIVYSKQPSYFEVEVRNTEATIPVNSIQSNVSKKTKKLVYKKTSSICFTLYKKKLVQFVLHFITFKF